MESLVVSSIARSLSTGLPSAPKRKHAPEKPKEKPKEQEKPKEKPKEPEKPKAPEKPKEEVKPLGPATCERIRRQQVIEPPGPAVNIDELSAATVEKLLKLPPLSSEPCIYRVPHRMRYSNDRHYTPRVVSIGPIHYHNKKLKANEYLKERYLAEFRQHTGVNLEECYELILNRERRLRNCYADVIDLNSENFVKMVMVDAAFLLMILVYNCFRILLSSSDRLFRKPRMLLDISCDMLLLENQLPFFILEDLYKLSKLQNILESEFFLYFNEENAMTYLGHQFCMMLGMTRLPKRQLYRNALHILDMLRSYLIHADWKTIGKEPQTSNLPSAKKLHQAGVKIQVGSGENMFDITFQNGILKVPPLIMDDSAGLIFRNLLAFELCHCYDNIFSSYFGMMRLLAPSSVDTQLLIQNGVIVNVLPNAQRISTLFQNIDTGNIVDWSQFLYGNVIEDLNEYYNSRWRKWKANVKLKYFEDPWTVYSVCAAVFALALTLIQTAYAVRQAYLPN